MRRLIAAMRRFAGKEDAISEIVESRVVIPKRAMVISNCQCMPLAAWLTTFSAETAFDFWGVHIVPHDEKAAVIAAFVEKVKAEYDLVLAIPLSEDFLELSTDRIVATFDGIPVVRISNMYFSGLHPDLTYLGGLGQRVVGPLIDYHSKLAIHGFLRGLSVPETQALFCTKTYETLGYYDEFATSLQTLKERDMAVDVRVTRILEDRLRTAICFFSVNHPTSALLSAYCDDIVHYLEEKGLGRHSGLPPDPFLCGESLAHSAIFPIYPEVAAHHGMPPFGSYAFKPDGARANPIDLSTFLTLEFEAFAQVGKDVLATSHVAQQMAARFALL